MNKMNLPLPFENDAIPGIFSADRENRTDRKRSRPAEPPLTPQIVEEDEDEEESEVAVETSTAPAASSPTARKRPRVVDSRCSNVADAADTQQGQSIGERSQWRTHKRPEGRATRVVSDAAQLSRAFQIVENSKQEPMLPRPGVITEAEVRRRRRPSLGTLHPKCGLMRLIF
jgi:hypothetical protein